MFVTDRERKGTGYYEFQFCKNKNPLKLGKINNSKTKYWVEDSISIADDEFDDFYKEYGKIFECAILSNGKKGFDNYGINYYDISTTKDILAKLRNKNDKNILILIDFLEKAINDYNGFYILGL